MPNINGPKQTKDILSRHGFNFKKRLGQNFLTDANVRDKIADSANISKEDFVLEIGPGMGTLTQAIAARSGKVFAVEIDRSLIPVLEETLRGYDNVTILHQDILKLDLAKLIREENGGNPIKVTANLPYYITTPIIMGLLEGGLPIKSITVMIQKEVAMRMQASPGTKDYGSLSLAVQYYTQPELIMIVSPNCFTPRPDVESAVLRLTVHDVPPIQVMDEKFMFSIIRAAFGQRRKTLVNAVSNADLSGVSKENISYALESMSLPLTIRGEALTLEEFAKLSDALQHLAK